MAQKKPKRHAAALKATRQAARRQSRNRLAKKGIRLALRKALEAAKAKESGKVPQLLGEAKAVLDKAARRGVMHWKAAARRKSRLEDRVAAILAGAQTAAPAAATAKG